MKNIDRAVKKPAILFMFGGAFVTGRRDDTIYNAYFNSLTENNNVVISLSYRLGLRGVQHVSKFNIKPFKNAVDMAVADVYDATNWSIRHADSLGIDTSIVSGNEITNPFMVTEVYIKENGK